MVLYPIYSKWVDIAAQLALAAKEQRSPCGNQDQIV